MPADRPRSVHRTHQYKFTTFPNCTKEERERVREEKKNKLDSKVCIVHCSTIGNKRNTCSFLCEDPSRISFGKMGKVSFLHFTPILFWKAILGLVQPLLGQWGLCLIAAQGSTGPRDREWADKNLLFRRKRDCCNLWTISRVVYYWASSFQNEQNTVQSLLRFCNKCVHFF